MENGGASSFLKPAITMVVIQIINTAQNILYKMVAISGMNLTVLIAYRLIFSVAFMVPLALILERKIRPKLTWVVLFQAFLLGLFGATMPQNLYILSLALTSPTYITAISNLVPAFTFMLAICFRLEKLAFRSKSYSSIAKIVGTVVGIGGAMLFTFYRGPEITIWSTHIDLLKQYHNRSSVPLPSESRNHVLGLLAGIGSMVSFAIWLIVQAKVGKSYPCPYSSTALMSSMGAIQSVIFSICMNRDWKQWKLGWDMRLWTAAYTGVVASGLSVVVMSWCVQKQGPLFVAVFNPLGLLLVAISSWLFLQEKITLGSVLGGVIIVCGLYIVLWGKSKEEPTIAPNDSQTSIEMVPSSV